MIEDCLGPVPIVAKIPDMSGMSLAQCRKAYYDALLPGWGGWQNGELVDDSLVRAAVNSRFPKAREDSFGEIAEQRRTEEEIATDALIAALGARQVDCPVKREARIERYRLRALAIEELSGNPKYWEDDDSRPYYSEGESIFDE